MKACRICLRMDVPMCTIGNTEAKNFLEDVLRLNGHLEGLDCRHYVCLMCKYLLTKSYNFIQRALNCQDALREIVDKEKQITTESLSNIDRSALNLDVNLICKNIYVIDIPSDTDEAQMSSAPTEYGEDLIEDITIKEELPDVLDVHFKNVIKKDIHNQTDISSGISDNDDNIDKECRNSENKGATEIPKECLNIKNSNSSITEDPLDNVIVIKVEKDTVTWNENSNSSISKDPSDNVIVKNVDNDTVTNDLDLGIVSQFPKSNNDKKKSHVTGNVNNIVDKETGDANIPVDDGKVVRNKPKRKYVRRKQKSDNDEDFDPGNMSESDSDSDSDVSLYHANGKRVKKPDNRVYPMDCADCNYEVQSKLDHFHHYLSFHRDKEYPYQEKKTLICHICGVAKAGKWKFKEHVRRHDDPEKRFQCDNCGKKFYSRQQLHSHMKRHTQKLICDYCQKEFPFRSELKLHIRTHTGEKPFSCHICGVCYAHRGNVQIHIKSVHQHMPRPNKKTNLEVKKKSKLVVKKKHKIKKKLTTKKNKHAKKTTPVESDEDDDVPLKLLKHK